MDEKWEMAESLTQRKGHHTETPWSIGKVDKNKSISRGKYGCKYMKIKIAHKNKEFITDKIIKK